MKRIILLAMSLVVILSLGMNLSAQPSAPSNLTASQASWDNFTFVKLQWKLAGTDAMNHLSFNIYRKDGAITDTGEFKIKYFHVFPEEMGEKLMNMIMWNDKAVQRGETYSYFVTAVNFSGESEASDTVQIKLDSVQGKAIVSGTLKNNSDGSPIVEGRVTLIPIFGWGMKSAETDSNGNFSFQTLAGSYFVYATARGYIPSYYDGALDIFKATKITLNSGDSLNIDVKLNPRILPKIFALSGTVTDTAGNPVAARIEVYSVICNAFSYKYYHAVTDSDGNYSVPVRQGDTVVVFAHSKNKEYYSQFYNGKSTFLTADRIGIGGDTSDINFVLNKKGIYNNGISGTILNDSNQIVSSIVIAIRLGDPDMHRKNYSTITDSLGTYSFTNLVPGNYIMLAIPQGGYKPTFFRYDGVQTMRWRNADSIVVSSSSLVTDINFTVSAERDSGAAFITGVVKDNQGNPLTGALVFAQDDNQQVYSFGITNQYGQYTIAGLIPGNYSVGSDLYGYTSSQTSTATLDYSTAITSTASFVMNPENVTSIKNSQNTVINNFELQQNYPNPFNPTTTISYTIPFSGKVVLKVFNVLGKEVATLLNSEQPAGNHKIIFNGSNFASGVYFYQLRAGNLIQTKKLILLK